MKELEIITSAYNQGSEYEYSRLKRSPVHEAELELTLDLFKEYIKSGSTVVDIGSGPGRYSEILLEMGCKVGLVDLSENSLNLFNERIDGSFAQNVLFTRVANATDLNWIDNESFSHALLMGPLYHLTKEKDRNLAIKESIRILKPGGLIFVAFISPYKKLVNIVRRDATKLFNKSYIQDIVENGKTFTTFEDHIIPQFRCWPVQAKKMMEDAGFETVRIRNLEGIGSLYCEEEKEILKDNKLREEWFNVLRMTCENPELLGATIHFLYVGRKN